MTEKEKAAAGYLFDPSADPQNAKDIIDASIYAMHTINVRQATLTQSGAY